MNNTTDKDKTGIDRRDFFRAAGAGLTAAGLVLSPAEQALAQFKTDKDRLARIASCTLADSIDFQEPPAWCRRSRTRRRRPWQCRAGRRRARRRAAGAGAGAAAGGAGCGGRARPPAAAASRIVQRSPPNARRGRPSR